MRIAQEVDSQEDSEDCQDLLRWLGTWLEKGRRRMGASQWNLGKLPKLAEQMADELGNAKPRRPAASHLLRRGSPQPGSPAVNSYQAG